VTRIKVRLWLSAILLLILGVYYCWFTVYLPELPNQFFWVGKQSELPQTKDPTIFYFYWPEAGFPQDSLAFPIDAAHQNVHFYVGDIEVLVAASTHHLSQPLKEATNSATSKQIRFLFDPNTLAPPNGFSLCTTGQNSTSISTIFPGTNTTSPCENSQQPDQGVQPTPAFICVTLDGNVKIKPTN